MVPPEAQRIIDSVKRTRASNDSKLLAMLPQLEALDLSGLVEGFQQGMAVATGDIVGYVGDSVNARGGAPHLHFGVYPRGVAPIDPKPILDHFLAEAEARNVVAALRAAQPQRDASPLPGALRQMVATGLIHPLARGGSHLPAEVVDLVSANPIDGTQALIDLASGDLIAGIDWRAGTPGTAGHHS